MKAVGFWWWSDMQTVPPKMPLEIYTTNVYTLGFWIFFFSNLLSYSFQKAIAFCDWYIALVDRVKRVHYAPCYCNVSNMHFIYWCILYICGCISVRIFRNMYKCNVHEALARMRGILDRSERDLTNNTGSYHTSLSYNWE